MVVELYQAEFVGSGGLGSVPLRITGSLRMTSKSLVRSAGLFNERAGIGEERNSSIRSVSGTGSIAVTATAVVADCEARRVDHSAACTFERFGHAAAFVSRAMLLSLFLMSI